MALRTIGDTKLVIAKDGTVTMPGIGEDADPIKVGKVGRDGAKWTASRDNDRKKQSFPRRQDALRWLVERG
jgi:hypothetical protein